MRCVSIRACVHMCACRLCVSVAVVVGQQEVALMRGTAMKSCEDHCVVALMIYLVNM